MELRDTVNGMTSADYKERFIAEYNQTKIRYEKLKDFCNKIEAAEIGNCNGTEIKKPQHDCPAFLLRDQQKSMGEYLHILELRAIIEEICLGEKVGERSNDTVFVEV